MATFDQDFVDTSATPLDYSPAYRRTNPFVILGAPDSSGLFGVRTYFPMRGYRTAGGSIGFVYWESLNTPDFTATSSSAPAGTIVDVVLTGPSTSR